ncbi:MAG: TrkH family potassium uptake protein [Thermoguttaceae bacterium]|nr:TrkH family potassium uptake protein [Thermoguttaceae bacterium]
MSFPRICRFLSYLSFLLGASMVLALLWAFPFMGQTKTFDTRSLFALTGSMLVCAAIGGILLFFGRNSVLIESRAKKDDEGLKSYNPDDMYETSEKEPEPTSGHMFRRESIAVVGLSWILAGLLSALPFIFSGVIRDKDKSGEPIPMSVVDCLFESFSGVTGFGASVLSNVEDPECIPKAIQFWRCELHFLGGLGIMVLFVAILGGRSAGKSLMMTEMPKTSNESPYAQAQKTAGALLRVYLGLNAVLILLLLIEGMPFYDAVCHSFSCIATGGFSSRNNSIYSFNSYWIETTLYVFMFISSCNFILLYYAGTWEKKRIDMIAPDGKEQYKIEFGIFRLLNNSEFRLFVFIVVLATVLVSVSCWLHGDRIPEGLNGSAQTVAENAQPEQKDDLSFASLCECFRYCGFQVMATVSSTGFGLDNYDNWNDFSRGILFVLFFTGGCVGSTTCGLKLMRLVVIGKTLWMEIERVFRPNVVRVIQFHGKPVEGSDEMRRSVLTYFALYAMVFAVACILLLAIEPASTWTGATSAGKTLDRNDQMFDSITAVATAYNCIGPSFGITGATENFGVFHAPAKILFIVLMLLGRLEIYILLVFLYPGFWKG